jgi:hypothetical protein
MSAIRYPRLRLVGGRLSLIREESRLRIKEEVGR